MSRSLFFIVTLFLGCLLLVSAETFEQSQLEEEQEFLHEENVIPGSPDSVLADVRRPVITSPSPSLIPLPPQTTFIPTLIPTLLPRGSQVAPPPPPGANPPSKFLIFSATLNDDRATPLTNGGLGVAMFTPYGRSKSQPHPLLQILMRTSMTQVTRAYIIRSPDKIPTTGYNFANINYKLAPNPDNAYNLTLTGDMDFVFHGRVRRTTIDAFLQDQVYGVIENALGYRVVGKFQNTYPTYLAYLNGTNEVPQTFSQAIGLSGTQIYLNETLISPLNLVNYSQAFMNSLVADNKIASNIFTNTIGAHIHGPADRTMNAPVIFPDTAMANGIFGTVIPVTLDVLKFYNKQQTYTNIHTTLYPGGSIRGQNLPLYYIENGAAPFNYQVQQGTVTGDFSLLNSLVASGSGASSSAITLTPSATAGNTTRGAGTTFSMTYTSTNNVPTNPFGITGRLLRGLVCTMNMKGAIGSEWDISIKSLTGRANYQLSFEYTGTQNFFTGFFIIPPETLPSFVNVNSKVWTINFQITSTGNTPLFLDYLAVNPINPNGNTNNELGPLLQNLYKDIIPPNIRRNNHIVLADQQVAAQNNVRMMRRRRNNRRVL